MKKAFFILLAGFFFYSCTSPLSPPPPNLIPNQKMVSVLYDLHVAEARVERMGVIMDTAAVYYKNLQRGIFKKHGITEAAFYKSYNYYVQNVSELDKIYEKVVDSLTVSEVQFGKTKEELKKADLEQGLK